MDMGECRKLHDLALRADFESASKKKDYYYDIDAMEHLESFILECDRKTELAKRRLKETQEELSEEAAAKVNVIHAFGEQIGTKLAKAEEVGAEGNVDESLRLMEEVEELKKQKSSAEQDYRNTMPASNYQQQKLRVCDVCCAFLGIHDNDRRLADHFGGKLHVGFITLRNKLDELRQTVEGRRQQRENEREERRRDIDRGALEIRRRSPSPGRRPRSRSIERRRRSRSRDKRPSNSREMPRQRSRSRERRRSREKSSREGRRSNSRHRSHKSHRRSRSRSPTSRSRRSSSKSSRSKRSGSHQRSESRSHRKRGRSSDASSEEQHSRLSRNSQHNSPDGAVESRENQLQ